MNRRRAGYGFLLVLILCPSLFAQILPFRNYTMTDGLPSNVVLALYQDSHGFLWIGTDEGLSIYDGASFTNYTVANGLPYSRVEAILESKAYPGTMWIATHGGGVARFAAGTFTAISLSPDPQENIVDALYEDERGTLWCVNHRGLTLLRNDSSFSLLSTERGTGGRIALGTDGLLWAGIDKKLFVYRGDSLLRSFTLDIHELASITSLCPDSNGVMWVGTEYGYLFKAHRTGILEQRRPFEITLTFILNEGEDLLAGVWSVGIVRIPKDTTPRRSIGIINEEHGLPETGVGNALRDREGTLWITGAQRGLIKLAEENVYRFAFKEMRTPGVCTADKRGHLWILLDSTAVEIWKEADNEWRQYHHAIGTPKGPKRFAGLDERGNLWMGTYDRHIASFEIRPKGSGPSRLRMQTTLGPNRPLPEGISTPLLIDRRSRLWVGSHLHLLAVVDVSGTPALRRVFRAADGFPVHALRAMHEDQRGNIWCGSFGSGLGVLRDGDWEKGSFSLFTTEHGLPDNAIRSIHQDAEGTLWVGTRHGGLAYIGGGGEDPLTALDMGKRFSSYSVRDGLLSSAVWAIAERGDGSLLLGSNGGVQHLHPGSPPVISTLRPLMGLNVGSVGAFNDEFLWCATSDAVVVYDLNRFRPDTIPPPVYLKRFIVNGQELQRGNAAELSYSQNTCTIEFIGISLRDERGVQYEYRLIDEDTTWNGPISERSVTFAKLSPGAYTFEVRARNAEGILSTTPARMTFTILAPFWQRWWFFASIGAVLVLLTAAAVWARARQLLAIERIRSRIATDLHDDLGASLTRITLFSSAAQKELQNGGVTGKLQSLLGDIGATSRDLVESLSDVVWSIDPANDSVDTLLLRMKTHAGRLLEAKGIEYEISISSDVPDLHLPLDYRRNLFLIFKEAVTNVVRHSGAASVTLHIRTDGNHFLMTVTDDGHGFCEEKLSRVSGLRNMRRRAGEMGGMLLVDTSTAGGTSITLRARIP